MTISKREKQIIEQRLAEFVKRYSETQVSRRQLAPSIGTTRENLYKIFWGNYSLTAYQLILLMNRLINEGINIEDVIRQIIGEGDQCVLNSGSSQLLQRQSLERQLASRLRRHR